MAFSGADTSLSINNEAAKAAKLQALRLELDSEYIAREKLGFDGLPFAKTSFGAYTTSTIPVRLPKSRPKRHTSVEITQTSLHAKKGSVLPSINETIRHNPLHKRTTEMVKGPYSNEMLGKGLLAASASNHSLLARSFAPDHSGAQSLKQSHKPSLSLARKSS